MNKLNGALLGLVCVQALPVCAEVEVYGRANVSYEFIDESALGGETYTDLVSNSSRLGVKGSHQLREGLNAIYQLEFKVDVDGSPSQETGVFQQRNVFVGLQGEFGSLIAGRFNTPLKGAQGKVDLFDDLRGDINNIISVNELRTNNTLMYTSPKIGLFEVSVAHVASTEPGVDDGASAALSYADSHWYLALAFDRNIRAEYAQAVRLVAQLELNALRLGALYEQYDPNRDVTNSTDGWLVSMRYQLDSEWSLKGQYGSSDMHVEGGEALSLGVDYQLSATTTLYSFFTKERAEGETSGPIFDNQYLGLGVNVAF